MCPTSGMSMPMGLCSSTPSRHQPSIALSTTTTISAPRRTRLAKSGAQTSVLKQVGALCGRGGLDGVLDFLRFSSWPAAWPVEHTLLASVSLARAACRRRDGSAAVPPVELGCFGWGWEQAVLLLAACHRRPARSGGTERRLPRQGCCSALPAPWAAPAALPLPARGAEHGARGEGIDGCCTDGGQGGGVSKPASTCLQSGILPQQRACSNWGCFLTGRGLE